MIKDERDQSAELKFLLKHSTIYGVGTVLNRAVAFLMLPLYTRHLTPTDYGIIELIDTTVGLIAVAVGLGLSGSLSRFYYERSDERARKTLVSTAFVLLGGFSLTVALLASAFAPAMASAILDDFNLAYYFRIAFVNLVLGILTDAGLNYLRMQYKSVLFITLSTLSLVIGVSLNVFFIAYLHLGVLSILLTSLIVRLVVGLPLIAIILAGTGVRFSVSDAKALLRYSTPLLPAMLGNTLVNYSDRYFLKVFTSIAEAGLYGLAQKLGGALHILVTGPFISTFQPRRFDLARSHPDLPGLLGRIFDAFFVTLLLLSLVLAVFTPEIMQLMTTQPYYRAGALIPLVLLYHFIFAMKYHVDWGIMFSGKTERYMWTNIATAVVQLVSAFVLIRPYGAFGAVCALLISSTFNVALLHFLASRIHPVAFNFLRIAKLVVAAGVVCLASQHIVTGHIALTILAKVGLLIGFVVMLPVAGLISSSEIAQVRTLVASFLGRPAVPHEVHS